MRSGFLRRRWLPIAATLGAIALLLALVGSLGGAMAQGPGEESEVSALGDGRRHLPGAAAKGRTARQRQL